jgi:LacI family transcriptional regulator
MPLNIAWLSRPAGLSVPADVSVIAIHDMPLASHLVPALTTVRMPLSELGRRAIEMIATRAPEDDITEIVTDPVEVILRNSTAPPGTTLLSERITAPRLLPRLP